MFKKKDIVFIVVVLLLAGVTAIFFCLNGGETGKLVRIVIDGREYGNYSIEESQRIEISNDYGENRIVIENYEVFMEHADCPDQYCVNHKAISKTNETIVCLPHRLVVELHGEKKEIEFDSIAR